MRKHFNGAIKFLTLYRRSLSKFTRQDLRNSLKDVVQQYIFRALSTNELEGIEAREGCDSVIVVLEDDETMRSMIAEILESQKGKLPGMKFPESER